VALGDVSQCINPKTLDPKKLTPCQPGNQLCPPGPFGKNTPQFHVRDLSCGENDPNGPSFDPVHKMYHLHYQNHVGLHGGRTYGHAVSKDFVHWAHMPVSIWNDHEYDSSAIYTGSASIVDGKVVQVYPGLCNTKDAGCPGGTNLCIAIPADPSDPLQTNWTKDASVTGAVNPIVNATGRDPSTAWQTEAGEWRLTTFDTVIMGSLDFKTWYRIGAQPGFPHGECPSFFPLPPSYRGAGAGAPGAGTPTHVHKASHGGKDWMQVGTYTANGVKENGNWSQTPGVPMTEQLIDAVGLYASKDFWDPISNRRINWGWARVPPASTQTLPREVTWHPELQQLIFSPVKEQDSLRGDTIGTITKGTRISRRGPWIGDAGGAAQSEIRVSFELPTSPVSLTVTVMADKQGTGSDFTIDYVPGASNATCHGGGASWPLKLLPSDKTLDLVIYVDNTFSEVYWMDGRSATTVTTGPSKDGFNGVRLTASADNVATVSSATAWSVKSIWVSPEEVLKQHGDSLP